MQINLKQPEIVEALKQYVTKQGFDLAGKSVGITFTAGRKEAGTSADIRIEDFPVLSVPQGEVDKPALSLVTPAEWSAAPAAAEEPGVVAAEPAKSLFGN